VECRLAIGTAHLPLAGGGIGTSPGGVALTFPQAMSRDFPLVTLVSMIAPSPDWFAGVDSLSMITNGNWATNLVATLYEIRERPPEISKHTSKQGANVQSPIKVTSERPEQVTRR
jgi:hypothetical protein